MVAHGTRDAGPSAASVARVESLTVYSNNDEGFASKAAKGLAKDRLSPRKLPIENRK